MKTPEKYRDRIFKAVVRYMEHPGKNPRAKRDAYEDLMVVIDDVIEKMSGRRLAAFEVCRCGHWHADHDAHGQCRICPNRQHRYEFYEYLSKLRTARSRKKP